MRHHLRLVSCWFVVVGCLLWAACGRPPELQENMGFKVTFCMEVAGVCGHGCRTVGVAQVPRGCCRTLSP